MEILIGKYSGFCSGVKNTIDKAKEILTNEGTVYCLGEIIHNEEVIKELSNMGMITIDDINKIPDNSKVIFRAHGEGKTIYEIAKNKNLEIFDLTCGKIKIIHKQISEIKDKFIIIIGKKNHPEVIGTHGFTNDGYIIEDLSDIDQCYQKYLNSKKNGIYIISQTTFSSHKFDEIINAIKKRFPGEIIINKSICKATEDRQNEVVELSKKVDIMLIIGSKLSSNTKELYNIAKENCSKTYMYQSTDDIKENFSKDDIIGIMAGASTPEKTVNNIIKCIKKLSI